jgi:hypothetical protein
MSYTNTRTQTLLNYAMISIFFSRNIICDEKLKDTLVMCPRCDKKCEYFSLHDTCGYSRVRRDITGYVGITLGM